MCLAVVFVLEMVLYSKTVELLFRGLLIWSGSRWGLSLDTYWKYLAEMVNRVSNPAPGVDEMLFDLFRQKHSISTFSKSC